MMSPTPPKCHCCGHYDVTLGKKRLFDCPKCHAHTKRDYNGAVNIAHKTLKLIDHFHRVALGKEKEQGEERVQKKRKRSCKEIRAIKACVPEDEVLDEVLEEEVEQRAAKHPRRNPPEAEDVVMGDAPPPPQTQTGSGERVAILAAAALAETSPIQPPPPPGEQAEGNFNMSKLTT